MENARVGMDWEKAKNNNTVESYEQYLRIHPESKFDNEARVGLKAVKAKRQELTDRFCENWSKLKYGMTRKEVEETLGFSISTYGGPCPAETTKFNDKFWSFEFFECKLVKWSHNVACDKY